jgi:type IV secretion system protein VirB10
MPNQNDPIVEVPNQDDEIISQQARGDFAIRGKSRSSKSKNKLFVQIGALLLLMLVGISAIGYFTYKEMTANTKDIDESNVKADPALMTQTSQDDALTKKMLAIKAKEEADRLAKEERERQERDKKDKLPGGNTTSDSTATSKTAEVSPALLRKLSGGVMVTPIVGAGESKTYGSSGQRSSGDGISEAEARVRDYANQSMPTFDDVGSGSMTAPVEGRRGSLNSMSGTGFPSVQAYLMPSRKYLLAHNTYTRCVLYTEIITDQPGLIECRLTEPLYSADGSVVIAEAGDRLTGEQRVEVRPGQTRVFTAWTELETTTGVRAKLDSLGAGAMGAGGTEAWIDNHYAQRFGGAIMLSFIQDALQAASNATQKNDSNYTVNNSERNVESMADEALKNSINIPPTAYILPGTVMTVVVARDIDFSSVFSTREKPNSATLTWLD